MSKRLGLTLVTASLLLSSAPGIAADGGQAGALHGLATGLPGHDDAVEKLASLYRQSPIGHRQPRPSDIPEGVQLSPLEQNLRRLDKEIDRKLVICRGC